jgi:NADH-quinone oxidoreductase subunit M
LIKFIDQHLLTLILFTPTIAAALLLTMPKERLDFIRRAAVVLSLIPLGLSIYLWFNYDASLAGFQFEDQVTWYQAVNSTYHVGIDGISVAMMLLTTLLTPLALIISWSITENVRTYMALFLFLETGMLGVFVSLDLLLFFVFWEIGLIPMYFLINQWGSANRDYASIKFLIYTMAGSLGLPITVPIGTVKAIAFWAFVIAFAIKVPVWPFHTWLPDAHTEAPTAGSMILAGVLLKLGAYGFLRFVLPFYPEQAKIYATPLAVLATLAIVLGAFASWGQDDFKRLVAYSSVNHMGFVVLGIAAAAYAQGTMAVDDAVIALNGAVLQMFNHGLSAAGMFLLVGVIYERSHTRDLNKLGGLFPLAPVYGGILLFTSMASLGLPGLNGFVSEFMVVRGVWPIFSALTAISMLGLLITGAYILKGITKVIHGPLNEHWVGHDMEINRREVFAIAPLMVLMLVIGVWPSWIVEVINATVVRLFG